MIDNNKNWLSDMLLHDRKCSVQEHRLRTIHSSSPQLLLVSFSCALPQPRGGHWANHWKRPPSQALVLFQRLQQVVQSLVLHFSPQLLIQSYMFSLWQGLRCTCMRTGEESSVSLGTRLAQHFLDFSSLPSMNDSNTKRLNLRTNTSNISTLQFESPCKSRTRAPSFTPLVELQPLIVSRFVFQVSDPPLRTTGTHSYTISDVIIAVSTRRSTHFH
jgi:hypothetical protein